MNTLTQPDQGRSTDSLNERIARLAAVVGHTQYSKQDRAALKRWVPGQALPLAFFRLWLRHLSEEIPEADQSESWMLLAWGIATMGAPAHQPGMPLGQALAESRYAEARLERLLSSPEDLRPGLYCSMIRFLSAKRIGFDWKEAARFVLARDAELRQAIHGQIAASYYRTQSKFDKE